MCMDKIIIHSVIVCSHNLIAANLCDYVTDGNGKTSSNQEVTSLVQSNAEAQGFFKKVAGVL